MRGASASPPREEGARKGGLRLDLEAVGDESLLVISTCYAVESCRTSCREGSVADGGVSDIGTLGDGSLYDTSRAVYDDAHTYDAIDSSAGGGSGEDTAIADDGASGEGIAPSATVGVALIACA